MRSVYTDVLAAAKLGALSLVLVFTSVACQTTHANQAQVYRVRVEAGDTLAAIARKYDTTWERIAALNTLPSGRPLIVGTVLRVSPGPGGLVATKEADGNGGGYGYGYGNGNGNGDDDEENANQDDVTARPSGGGLLFGGGEAHGGVLEWPIYGALSSQYGMRHGRFHHGIDIRAKTGSTVLASGPGVVEFAGKQRGFGKVVIVRHKTMKTLYAHLSSVQVKVGQAVTRTSEIGSSGHSGNSTGPHLHFEIRDLANHSVDPLTLIAKDKLLSSRR